MANLICTYNVTSTTGNTVIYSDKSDSFSDILYNGVSIGLVTEYTFPSRGEHTLEFVLKDKTTIGNDAFYGCSGLTSINIPDSVTEIGYRVFVDCTSLNEITIPDSVTTIRNYVFHGCSGLTSIVIPDSVTTIGSKAFGDCTSLTDAYIGKGVTSIGNYSFGGCFGLTSIVIPDSVTTIHPYAFASCTGLTNITIGKGVTEIPYGAFKNGSSLTEIVCYVPTAPTIESDAFGNIKTGGTLYYPAGSDYSQWLSTDEYYLGYYSWNGVELEPDIPPTPDEPAPQPSVIISKSQMNFDNIGDEGIIQVTYINVNEIVPPEVGDGFEIEEISREELSGNRIQVTYKVIRISRKKQNSQINFIGKGGDGLASSNKVSVKGEAIPADINLWSFEIKDEVLVFEATGGTAQVDVLAYGVNPPYEFKYKIYDDNFNLSCIYDELDEDNGEDAYWRYKFTSNGNNSNDPYTGTIDFTFKDELTDKTIILPFYVRYANEGRIEAGSYSYKYDKDGKNLNTLNGGEFGIFYYNIETINEPECDSDWLIVGQGVDASKNNYTKYNYSITIKPNSGIERKCYVTFSGKGIDGRNHTLEMEVIQEGTDSEIIIDSGMITLKSLSLTFPSTGGTDTFQVDYVSPVEINAPIFEGNWATITEISSEDRYDTAYNGVEDVLITTKTYQVTVTEHSTSGRQGRVKLSGIFWDNIVYEKNKFIIYQLAEGSTEIQGSVTILRYSNTFTYYGSPTGWDFRVAYDNVTPDTPVISESWCRIAEVKDLKADEYDYYKEYILDMDTNNSNFSRTCTITFIGNAEDGSQIKIPFQFTQQGQEEIINEGEYANYKGYFMDFEGVVHSVSFITNPKSETYGDIRLAGESPVVVSYTENDELYEPLRTSTCTIKVITSNYLMNLYTGKAKGTRVILRNEDTGKVEWCGYLQPNLYNQGFTECLEEVEFEASDCLSVLQYLKYEYYYNGNGQPMIIHYSDLVESIMDECELITSYNITQKLFTNSQENKVIDFKEFFISENNFYSEEGEPWTLQEIMEETCKFFGFVCFQWGDEIYFMDFDKYQSNKKMYGLKYTKSDYRWNGPEDIYISDKGNSITEKSYRGTGADISLDDVFNKVSVNCNYYNVEQLIPDLFDDDNLEVRNRYSLTNVVNRGSEIGRKTDFIAYNHKNINSFFYLPIIDDVVHQTKVTPTEEEFSDKTFIKTYVGGNIVDMVSLNYSELNKDAASEPKDWEKYLLISQLNRPWCYGYGQWEEYNLPIMEFHNLPQIFIDNNEQAFEEDDNDNTGRRNPSTKSGIGDSYSNSRNDRPNVVRVNKGKHYLILNAEAAFVDDFNHVYIPDSPQGFGKKGNYEYGGYVYDTIKGLDKEYNFSPALTFYLEVPQKGWWNGNEWVDYETWFEVPLEKINRNDNMWYNFTSVKNTVATNLFLGKAGYKIELPEEMDSTAFMQFKIGMPKRFAHVSNNHGGDNIAKAGNAYCFIKDLNVNIVSKNSSLMKDEDMIYENVIDEKNVIEGPEWELKITSDNYINYSFSTVSTRYGDGKPTTNFRFFDKENNLILPEEAIINRFVNQYSTPSIKENVTLDMSFKPTQLITDSYWGDGKNFVIVAQELDFKMCRQEVTLLEKK